MHLLPTLAVQVSSVFFDLSPQVHQSFSSRRLLRAPHTPCESCVGSELAFLSESRKKPLHGLDSAKGRFCV